METQFGWLFCSRPCGGCDSCWSERCGWVDDVGLVLVVLVVVRGSTSACSAAWPLALARRSPGSAAWTSACSAVVVWESVVRFRWGM